MLHEQLPSVHELRRRAPMHYWAKADNARLAARTIHDTSGEAQTSAADAIGYSGSTRIALHESFLRECSIALELIIKAVVAQRIEMGTAPKSVQRVPFTHDLISLWEAAKLGPLKQEDRHTLVIAKRTLNWAGRYAAPKDDRSAEADYEEERRVRDLGQPLGRFRIHKTRTITWEQFDRAYNIAALSFWQLRQEYEREVPYDN